MTAASGQGRTHTPLSPPNGSRGVRDGKASVLSVVR